MAARFVPDKYRYRLDDGRVIEYETAAEFGKFVGENGIKMGNPYDPINTEYDEFNEARWAATSKKENK